MASLASRFQRGHDADRHVHDLCGSLFALACGGDDPRADGLGQHQNVAGLGRIVGGLLARLDHARHGKAVLGLLVVNGVPANDEHACFVGLLVPALQDAAQYRLVHVGRPAEDVHGQQRPSAHGVDVAQRVGHGDGPVPVGVVHDGGEEVHCLNEGQVPIHPVDRGVIPGAVPHQEVGILDLW